MRVATIRRCSSKARLFEKFHPTLYAAIDGRITVGDARSAGLAVIAAESMPAGRAAAFDHARIAMVLARQGALGVILGISGQALLTVSSTATSCPGSASARSTSRAVADLNLPMRVWQLFGGAALPEGFRTFQVCPRTFRPFLR
jgi:hypothetical protein